MILVLMVGVPALLVGVLLGVCWTDGRRDLLAEALVERGERRVEDLPEPTDEEIRRMVAASRLAADDEVVPFAYNVLVLGAALLRCRQRAAKRSEAESGRATSSDL
ncbi:MAG: hypothetical protein R6X20_04895 [Phycisphaerae bacterium]